MELPILRTAERLGLQRSIQQERHPNSEMRGTWGGRLETTAKSSLIIRTLVQASSLPRYGLR